jgi:transcriptional regulator with XRE-family HTH domain
VNQPTTEKSFRELVFGSRYHRRWQRRQRQIDELKQRQLWVVHEIAVRCDVSSRYINRLMASLERRNPSPQLLRKLAKWLRLPQRVVRASLNAAGGAS